MCMALWPPTMDIIHEFCIVQMKISPYHKLHSFLDCLPAPLRGGCVNSTFLFNSSTHLSKMHSSMNESSVYYQQIVILVGWLHLCRHLHTLRRGYYMMHYDACNTSKLLPKKLACWPPNQPKKSTLCLARDSQFPLSSQQYSILLRGEDRGWLGGLALKWWD